MKKHMENHLQTPLEEVLPVMQEGIMTGTSYFGIKTLKNPLDAWIYQEMMFESRPDVIIEIGNYHGGSALYLAHLCDAIGKGRVIGIDLSHKSVPPQVLNHPRISLVEGDACKLFDRIAAMVASDERVMVIEDSAHTFDNTLGVLRLYSTLLKTGDHFIVEDSICHHGLDIGPNPGPYEAIQAFLQENADFEADRGRERFLITWNPMGYLRRIQQSGPPNLG